MIDPEDLFGQALSYWASKRTGDSVPPYVSLDPSEIPKLLPYIILINVHHDPLDFSYGLTGGAVRNLMPENRRGQVWSNLPGKGVGSGVWENMRQVVESGMAAEFKVPYAGGTAKVDCIRYLALPWTKAEDAGGRVDIVSHVVWVPDDTVFIEDLDLYSSL